MKKRSLKIDRLRFDIFILLMYFLYYSTFMIDIQYFNSLIVIFHIHHSCSHEKARKQNESL